MYKLFITLLLIIVLSGCQGFRGKENVPPYYWGSYESLLYKSYTKPNKATPLVQIKHLERDILKAEKAKKITPPGVYGHLGLMQMLNKNIEKAVVALKREKELYPMSSVWIDGMLERIQGVNSEKP